MPYSDPELVSTVQKVIEFVGTFAFAISGIRHAAAKHFDWFGGMVCGIAVAIGGGTIRDMMLGVTPFWMTSALYIICTALAQLSVIIFAKYVNRLDNAWFVVLLNNVPVIFRKEIYAMASIAGGLLYWAMYALGVELGITVIICFCVICLIRFIAMKYHISLPRL